MKENSGPRESEVLEPSLGDLHDPYLLHDMDRQWNGFVRPLKRKISSLRSDYDGGMTSAIVKESLERLGAECRVYLPNRFTDSYGLMQVFTKYFYRRRNFSGVTVDNG